MWIVCQFSCFDLLFFFFFFSSRRRHSRCLSDWSSDVCSSDLELSVERAHAVPKLLQNFVNQLLSHFHHRAPILNPALQIGRASCRERAYISALAVLLSRKRVKKAAMASMDE